MIVKTYGIFDSAAKEYVRTFTAKNDEVAERSVKYIVRDPGFDKIAGKDYVVQHLYDFDSETGVILDNSITLVCNMASAIDEAVAEERVKREEVMALQKPITKEEHKDA